MRSPPSPFRLPHTPPAASPMLISPHAQHVLPYPPPILPTLSAVPTPPLPSSLSALFTPPSRPSTPPPVASASSGNSVCTFHTSSSGSVVDHKPRNLKVLTSHGTFTLAIKESAEKIKRRANKVGSCTAVYLGAESADDHNGVVPGRKFNRRKHRSLIGTKAITTQPPPADVPHLQLTGVDSERDWLYEVETKGGDTRGREKQKYILLRTDSSYKVEVGGDWARGSHVQLLDIVLEDHTGVKAVRHDAAGRIHRARMAMDDVETGEADTETVDEKHNRPAAYPLLSTPPFMLSFASHSQSQPLTSMHTFHHSTTLYPTHSAPLDYSSELRDIHVLSGEDDERERRASFSVATDEVLRRSTFFPAIFVPPHSFTWPGYSPHGPPSSSAVHQRTQPPPPPSMQSYPSTSSTTSSSSSSSNAPTQRTSTHHIRNWSSGSSSSLVSTVSYSPTSYTSSSSSSVSYTSSSASSTPTHFQHASVSGSNMDSRWASQSWLMIDTPVVSSLLSPTPRIRSSVKPSDTRVPDMLQPTELENGVDVLFLNTADTFAPEPMDADTLFTDCYSPLSSTLSLTDSTAWSPAQSTADEPDWPELPDDMQLALPVAFLSLPPTPPPMVESTGDNTAAELFVVQSIFCTSICVCLLFLSIRTATEIRQSLSSE